MAFELAGAEDSDRRGHCAVSCYGRHHPPDLTFCFGRHARPFVQLHSPMKLIPILASCFVVVSAFASELRVEMQPERSEPSPLKIPSEVKTSRKEFYRDDKKVASIVDWKMILKGVETQHARILQFLVAPDTWVEIDLDKRKVVTSKASVPLFVTAVETSVTVTAPTLGYTETYFFEEDGSFMDGQLRDSVYSDFLKKAELVRPR